MLELQKLSFRSAQIHLEMPFLCRAAHKKPCCSLNAIVFLYPLRYTYAKIVVSEEDFQFDLVQSRYAY